MSTPLPTEPTNEQLMKAFTLTQSLDKMLAVVIHKAYGKGGTMIKFSDIEKFEQEMKSVKGSEAQIVIQGTEDGIRLRVLTHDESEEFLKDYTENARGVVMHK